MPESPAGASGRSRHSARPAKRKKSALRMSSAQIRRTGVATAVVSTMGIALVNTAGIAHSQTPTSLPAYSQASTLTGVGNGTDSLSDPTLVSSGSPIDSQIAADTRRAIADKVGLDTSVAALVQKREVSDQLAEAAERAAALWVRPDIGRLTQGFGGASGHPGIDLGGPYGSNILAAHGGTVIYAGWETGYGYFIQILHPGNIVTCYGHLSQMNVRVGQQVTTGQVIALEGNTGDSTGPHLHFEVRLGGQDGTKVDPLAWLAAHGVAI